MSPFLVTLVGLVSGVLLVLIVLLTIVLYTESRPLKKRRRYRPDDNEYWIGLSYRKYMHESEGHGYHSHVDGGHGHHEHGNGGHGGSGHSDFGNGGHGGHTGGGHY